MTSEDTRIRVVVIDDHLFVADALAETLEGLAGFVISGTAGSLARGLTLVEEARPDVVVMDVRLPDGDGAAGTGEVLARSPETRVLVLSAQTGIDVIARAVHNGASGFLAKTTPLAELVDAIRAVHGGSVLFDPPVLRDVARYLSQRGSRLGDDLTERELEVLQLLAQGMTTADIATRLFLSHHTVRNHVRHILQKLDAHSQLEAVAVAAREGLVDTGAP